MERYFAKRRLNDTLFKQPTLLQRKLNQGPLSGLCPSPFDLKSNDHREATVSRNENCLYCLLQNVTSYM